MNFFMRYLLVHLDNVPVDEPVVVQELGHVVPAPNTQSQLGI